MWLWLRYFKKVKFSQILKNLTNILNVHKELISKHVLRRQFNLIECHWLWSNTHGKFCFNLYSLPTIKPHTHSLCHLLLRLIKEHIFWGNWASTIERTFSCMVNQQIWTNYRTFGFGLHFNYPPEKSCRSIYLANIKERASAGNCADVKGSWWLSKNFFFAALIHADIFDVCDVSWEIDACLLRYLPQISRVTKFSASLFFNETNNKFRNSVFIFWADVSNHFFSLFFCAFSFHKMKNIFLVRVQSWSEWVSRFVDDKKVKKTAALCRETRKMSTSIVSHISRWTWQLTIKFSSSFHAHHDYVTCFCFLAIVVMHGRKRE